MTDFTKLYNEYGRYNIFYNQLSFPSPSEEYSWRRTKKLLHNEAAIRIREILKEKKQVSVLDIGCGNGAFLIRLAYEFPSVSVQLLGIELSKPFVEYANQAVKGKKLKNVSFQQVDFEKESLKGEYDIIVSSEVLEHVEKPEAFLKKVHMLLVVGGYFLLSTPNGKNIIKYPLFFLKGFITRFHEKEIKKVLSAHEETLKLAEHEQHLFIFTYALLKRKCKQAGFGVYKTPRSTTFFGGPFLDDHSFLFSLTILFDTICNLLPFSNLGWDTIVFTRKEK